MCFYLKYKKLTSLHYCVRVTKSHIQNSRNHFAKIQSNRTTNWLPLHRSRDLSTHVGRLPMRGSLWPCVYFAPLGRYGASKIMGSRPWPVGVTWRHR